MIQFANQNNAEADIAPATPHFRSNGGTMRGNLAILFRVPLAVRGHAHVNMLRFRMHVLL
jgi:hypothetical protein